MANATAERIERNETRTQVQPFTIEVDHPRNCDLLLQSIPGCRLRSAISAGRTVKDVKTGELRIPQDQSRFLGQLPPVPGMQLAVNPSKLTYEVIDPLHKDIALCDRIQSSINRMEESPVRISGKLRGVPPIKGTLDVHRMKTLCREIGWLLEANEVKVINGVQPSQEEVEAMPGHFMTNPGSQVHNSQPRFEKDFDAWLERMQSAGG